MRLNIFVPFVLCLCTLLSSGYSQESAVGSDTRLRRLATFIESAPKPTEKSDLAYAIKLREKDRREALRRCDDIIAADPMKVAPRRLREKLCSGVGPMESIASIPNSREGVPPSFERVFGILAANLINCSGAGTRGFNINVSQSHASRARYLLASAILKEGLPVTLWSTSGKVKPEDALKDYNN